MRMRWNCPGCAMSSNRHWNVRRHISRIHDGIGEPRSSFMMQDDRNPNSRTPGFNYTQLRFHRSGSSQDHTSTKEQRTKTLVQSMDEVIEPTRKLVEYTYLLNQLFVLNRQLQTARQIFYPMIIPSQEIERHDQPTSAHHPNPISVPDFYGHIKATARKFDLD
jgi:hypothetical protein